MPESDSEIETEQEVVATELTLIELSGRLIADVVVIADDTFDARSLDKSWTCWKALLKADSH